MSRSHTHAQHFLRSPRLVHELIGHSNLKKRDTVYDLGAGSGVITAALASRSQKVVAVEVEPQALTKLRTNVAEHPNVEIKQADIMSVDLPAGKYKVFSNIPFNLSSAIIHKLTNSDNSPAAIYLITQKQFARKVVPSDRHFTSMLGAQIAPWWRARIRRPLRKTDFTPPPAVDTVLLELLPHAEPMLELVERDDYQAFIERCFAMQQYFAGLPRAQAGVDPERKPSELNPAQWVELYRHSRL